MDANELLQKRLDYVSTLNEKNARHYVGLWALEIGWGGISRVNEFTGKSMNTIRKGIGEIKSCKMKTFKRIRKEGGGRKKLIDKNPKLKKELKKIMQESTAGDPMTDIIWATKSSRNIMGILNNKGFKISYQTIIRDLKKEDYTLKANLKTKEGKSHKDRDSQFRHINKKSKEFKRKGEPHISVDAKKKEYIGNFKNPGRIWSEKGLFEQVNTYDFPSLADGRATPYGIYDPPQNKGFVNVGSSRDTGEFAVESIRKWWELEGKSDYSDASEILICADGGGSNGSRNSGWKYYLQKFADDFGIKITVCHYPPGTSKWNKIEHRMFSHISMNWKGKPIVSFEFMIDLINATKTRTGLKLRAVMDRKVYENGKKFTKEQMEELSLERDTMNPQWNYMISPHK